MAMSIEIIVAIVAVAKLNLIAKRISLESKAVKKALQLVNESMETTMPTKNMIRRTRVPIVTTLNTLSPTTPLKTLNIGTCPQMDFYLTRGL
jgi:hypothetical protein